MRKKKIEVKKLSFIDKIYLNLELPDLDEYKKENSDKKIRLRLVDINKVRFLENLATRVKGYLKQLTQQFKEINELKETVKLKENARRKVAGKVGGLQASLNKEKDKNKELLDAIDNQKEHYENKVSELENNIKNLEVKLEESMSDKYLVKKIPSGRRPKTQTMKLRSCTVQSNIARKMFGDNK